MQVASCFSSAKAAALCAPVLHFSALMPRYIFFRTGGLPCQLLPLPVSVLAHRKPYKLPAASMQCCMLCAGEPQAMGGKVFVSLLSPTAFTFAADLYASYEGGGSGMSWANVWDDPFPLGGIMIMLAVDSVLYCCLAWYADKVRPSLYTAGSISVHAVLASTQRSQIWPESSAPKRCRLCASC